MPSILSPAPSPHRPRQAKDKTSIVVGDNENGPEASSGPVTPEGEMPILCQFDAGIRSDVNKKSPPAL